MSSDPSKNVIDPFFDSVPANVQVVVDTDGSRKIIETRTITAPNTISYSATPGQTVYTAENRAIAPTGSYVTYSATGGASAQPRVSSATFQNVITQPGVVTGGTQYVTSSNTATGFNAGQTRVVSGGADDGFFGGATTGQTGTYRYETTTVQQPISYVTSTETRNVQPTYVSSTETRTVQQPVQVVQTTRTVEQPVQVIKTVTTTTETRPQGGFQTSSNINTYEQNTPLLQGEKYNDAAYNFYDGDVEDVHTEAPVSAGPPTAASCPASSRCWPVWPWSA
jgi:hypothetical protein